MYGAKGRSAHLSWRGKQSERNEGVSACEGSRASNCHSFLPVATRHVTLFSSDPCEMSQAAQVASRVASEGSPATGPSSSDHSGTRHGEAPPSPCEGRKQSWGRTDSKRLKITVEVKSDTQAEGNRDVTEEGLLVTTYTGGVTGAGDDAHVCVGLEAPLAL
ncbi:hypothetical protein AAFF_G00092910 [Aldrovandia affinis]|uniref:Uncharacterized protein n=1 Tax=Aldrovandia affinis TaxID=143900 RepID=A0AAD7WY41_9TELE|nr:hypothetical protein AAFF_G00092910 [Aldrovandia affinis]